MTFTFTSNELESILLNHIKKVTKGRFSTDVYTEIYFKGMKPDDDIKYYVIPSAFDDDFTLEVFTEI